MDILRIAIPAGFAVLLLIWWSLRWRRRKMTAQAREDRIDTLIGWPPQATRVMNRTGCEAFRLLSDALPDHMVLAQVPLSRFLSVPKRLSYADWLRRLGYQCVDFAVCDMQGQVLVVVDLQPPPASASERSRKRLTRMTRSLKAAKIPLLVWSEQALPTPQQIRESIFPSPVAVTPTPASAGPSAAQSTGPAPAFNPFDDAARDSTQDELLELLEPPPTTWFDDLDSERAPLARPKA